MIDKDGFRNNVGIVLANDADKLFWARRVGKTGWQFPQGGIKKDESLEQALYRELTEEVGVNRDKVEILGVTEDWVRYKLPKQYIRYDKQPLCIGQKQRWFLLRFRGVAEDIRLDTSPSPEFDAWRWVDYWRPLSDVIFFKQQVYRQVLMELGPLLFSSGMPPIPED
ncbi:MAG: RNA pyrophosphohydrolase [Gammaproteobacteria bacterium]|nr:RNA pyrophosphohydrolase [Gammaproteobacteria bacterium]